MADWKKKKKKKKNPWKSDTEDTCTLHALDVDIATYQKTSEMLIEKSRECHKHTSQPTPDISNTLHTPYW